MPPLLHVPPPLHYSIPPLVPALTARSCVRPAANVTAPVPSRRWQWGSRPQMDRGLTSAQATAILRNLRERKRKRRSAREREREWERVPEKLLSTTVRLRSSAKRTVYSQRAAGVSLRCCCVFHCLSSSPFFFHCQLWECCLALFLIRVS